MAVAHEQEMKAAVQEMRARVVEAEAEVPKAMAAALREGKLGVMDYYQMQNTIADTNMRDGIAKASAPVSASEKKCDAPDCRKTNNSINNSAEKSGLTAEYPCNKIKLEKSNTAPVKASDDHKNKRYSV